MSNPIRLNPLLGKAPTVWGIPRTVFQAALPVMILSPFCGWYTALTMRQLLWVNLWWIATFWLVTGGNAYHFFSQFYPWFYRPWYRSYRFYQLILNDETP